MNLLHQLQRSSLFHLLRERTYIIKIAATVLVLLAALVFFGHYGENETISLQQAETGQLVETGDAAQAETAVSAAESTAASVGEGTAATAEIYVDISGQVRNPGVYAVLPGSRLFEVVEKAGGLLEEADPSQINQAETVSDGQKIIVPALGEVAVVTEQTQTGSGTTDAQGRININTADSTALQEIPGVGPATAEKILTYRSEHGAFAAVEELKNISGIGEKTFQKMKDKVTI